ncbi:hypothetical protein FHS67_002200 [Aminobacter aminovorans]|uniref:Uncharacterized protein n=1 Tax=Aminobacter aminovorans TaxID=83263 RepID=A0AAC8YN85_AMIAI|nr:hypothetical protein AA2016_2209 [Aminobacter aminovorans]MBB3705881.1 hypothetical protein [Aminobacter aminovorans]
MNPQAINRRTFIGGVAVLRASVVGGKALGQPAAPEVDDAACSGSCLYNAGGRYWWQVWQDRDDIAPGFRIGTIRQIG